MKSGNEVRLRAVLTLLVNLSLGVGATFGPSRWSTSPTFATLDRYNWDGTQFDTTTILGTILLIAAGLIVLGWSAGLINVKRYGGAVAAGVFLVLAIVSLWTCRPGGESQSGPAGGCAFLLVAFSNALLAIRANELGVKR